MEFRSLERNSIFKSHVTHNSLPSYIENSDDWITSDMEMENIKLFDKLTAGNR